MSSSILFPTNEYATSSKSSQEIQQLMMPEGLLSQLDALEYIFNKGHPLQQPYAYRNFYLYPDQLLATACERLSKQDVENQIIIAQSLKSLLGGQPRNEHILMIFHSAMEALANWNSINNQHLIEIVDSALEASKQKQQLFKKLETTILGMGRASEPIISKVISGRLIPVFLKRTGRGISGEMIDIVKRIISDSEVEAKKIWISQIFPELLQNLKLELIELHLQEKIYEKVYDENEEIGLMALEVILRNVTKFSIEQQGSRIVKLFIDSFNSKNEKIAIMASSFMGETFQKLQHTILKNQATCLKFWKSFIEVAESKNEKILANFIFNLPGILYLSRKYHKVDPMCEVYTELYFNPDADTFLLVSYFHQMVQMFPNKLKLLRQTAYCLFSQAFETQASNKQTEPYEDETLRILDCLICNLFHAKDVFLFQEHETQQFSSGLSKTEKMASCTQQYFMRQPQQEIGQYFDSTFTEHLNKYFSLCLQKKNGNYLKNLYRSIQSCHEKFSPKYSENVLLPKLYSAVRGKTAHLKLAIKVIVIFLSREVSSSALINTYASKVNIQLSKSSRSHERQAAMYFFSLCSEYFSIDLFQEFKMGEKFLQFHNQKILKNKIVFINSLEKLVYYFNREEKIEFAIILNKMRKDPDPEVQRTLQAADFTENQEVRQAIQARSKQIKEQEKKRVGNANGNINSKRLILHKRQTKELKKQDLLRKRVETKSKTKMLIKQVPKRRTPMVIRPMLKKI